MKWRMVFLEEEDWASYNEAFRIARENGLIPNTFYLFTSEPTAYFGVGSGFSKVKPDSCRKRGVKIARGDTIGSNALYFDRFTYVGFIHYHPAKIFPSDIETVRCQRGIINALSILGLKSEPKKDGNDVLIDGKKVCSIGIHVYKEIQMTTFVLLADFDFETAERVIVPKHDMRTTMTTLKSELGREVRPEELVTALRTGFEPILDAEFGDIEYELTDAEKEIVASLREKYTSESWIKTGRWSPVKDYGR